MRKRMRNRERERERERENVPDHGQIEIAEFKHFNTQCAKGKCIEIVEFNFLDTLRAEGKQLERVEINHFNCAELLNSINRHHFVCSLSSHNEDWGGF